MPSLFKQSLVLYLIINFGLKSSFCQLVTRFVSDSDTDEFPNPNTGCTPQGCAQAGGYKFCLDCCSCRCNDGSYWSASKNCLQDTVISKGCKFVLRPDSYQSTVAKTSAIGLKNGVQIFYCSNSWSKCSTKATKCIIDRATTFYENGGWKILWKTYQEMDMQLSSTGSETDRLQWGRSTSCSRKNYNGLLISLGLSCMVNNASVSSCLVYKVAGSYRIGTDPLSRANCTAPTTTSATTTTMTASTTATTVTSSKTAAAATTESAATTAITSVSTRSTASKPKTFSSTPKTHETTPTMPPTTTKITTMTKAKNNMSTENSTRSEIFPSTTGFSNHSTNGNISHRDTKQSKSKRLMIMAITFSVAAALLVIIVIILVKRYKNGRRLHNHQEHISNRKMILNISNPQPLNRTAPLPTGAQANPSGVLWTINTTGNFVAIDSAPIFTIHPKSEPRIIYDDDDDDDYDEPIGRRTSSLGKLYAVVKKHKRSSQKAKDDGYSSIDDISMSMATNNAFLHDEKDGPRKIVSSQGKPQLSVPQIVLQPESDPIYDLPESTEQTTVESGPVDINGPVYAIYEPAAERGSDA